MRKSNILCLEGTCRVSTMIIDLKKKRKVVQKIEIITINSSKNDKSDHNFTTVPPRREVRRQKNTLLY
jgi:hypothetical protein